MIGPRGYTMQELSAITGISMRRIKLWKAYRAIPPALGGRGRLAYYTDDHIRRIEEIKRDYIDGRVMLIDLADRYNPEPDDELTACS